MREVLVGTQVIGGVLALFGVYCLAALPLSDYRWYNRAAVMVLMSPMVCWPAILGLVAVIRALPFAELVAFAFGALLFGSPLILILRSSSNVMALSVTLGDRLEMDRRLWLMPIGLAVQLVLAALICLLALFGIRV